MNTGADSRTRGTARSAGAVRRRTGWVCGALALVLVVWGFAGLDRWFYEHVSLVLETKDRPLDRDFFTLTWPFWWGLRYAFGHVIGVGVIFALLFTLRSREWPRIARLAVVLAVTAGLANVLQAAIGRMRPNQADSHLAFKPLFSELFTKLEVSFPSGEAATAFALAWVMTQFLPRWWIVFYGLAGLTAAARLVNGAHYLSDVAAGGIFGVLMARALDGLARRIAAADAGPQGV